MYEENYSYDLQIYPQPNQPSFTLEDLGHDLFKDRNEDSLKELPNTGRFNQQDQNGKQPALENEELERRDEQNHGQEIRGMRKIQLSKASLMRIKKTMKGRPKESKNITQIFKTETVRYLSMLSDFQILSQSQRFQIEKFKQESLSLRSFISLSQNFKIKEKLKKFYQSSEFAKCVLMTPRLNFSRKIQIIKRLSLTNQLIEANQTALKEKQCQQEQSS